MPDAIPSPLADIQAAARLRQAGQSHEAEAMLDAVLARHPHDADALSERARIAQDSRDWTEALRRWDVVATDFVGRPEGPLGAAAVLLELDRPADALNVVLPALRMFPGDPALASLHARIAARLDANPAAAPSEGIRALFARFESIGDTCEFGIVQRRFGAEPLGLLRWASTTPDNLVRALDTDLAGVGDPEHTIVEASHGEYATRDRRHGMFSHTFTPAGSVPIERFLVQQCRRMQFLRRKLLEDLAAGVKIFVYKSATRVTDAQLAALYAALRRHNPGNTLLCLRLQDAAHSAGTLDQAAPRLFVGYTDRFSTIDIPVATWLALCEATARLRDA